MLMQYFDYGWHHGLKLCIILCHSFCCWSNYLLFEYIIPYAW